MLCKVAFACVLWIGCIRSAGPTRVVRGSTNGSKLDMNWILIQTPWFDLGTSHRSNLEKDATCHATAQAGEKSLGVGAAAGGAPAAAAGTGSAPADIHIVIEIVGQKWVSKHVQIAHSIKELLLVVSSCATAIA